MNRRELLGAALAGGVLAANSARADMRQRDPHRFALLADTHIPSCRGIAANKVNMAANLSSVVEQLTALDKPPASTFIIGDCAHLAGKAGDYKLLGELLAPLAKAEMPVQLCLGNHDDRANCLAAFAADDAPLAAELERRVTVIASPHANWFLLDSLDKVDKTPGLLGEKQLAWLSTALAAHADKPALIAVHHHLTPIGDAASKVPGLVDTPELLAAVKKHAHVQAIFFGHTHVWSVVEHAGIHLVNLPPVAYVFAAGQPNGWVDCQTSATGLTMRLVLHNPAHELHNHVTELRWK